MSHAIRYHCTVPRRNSKDHLATVFAVDDLLAQHHHLAMLSTLSSVCFLQVCQPMLGTYQACPILVLSTLCAADMTQLDYHVEAKRRWEKRKAESRAFDLFHQQV